MATRRASEAWAKVGLESKPFIKAANDIVSAATAMSSAIVNTFTSAGASILAAFGADSLSNIAKTAKEILTFGEQMANAGKKAGLAAGQFYLFNSALEKGIGLKTATSLLGANADALNRSAGIFRDVSIKLWAVGEKIRGFWLGLMERVAPVLSHILDGALGVQLVSAGNKFGEVIANGIAIVYQLAKDGKLWETFKQGFALAFNYAGERMIWLGGIGYEILRVAFSKAMVDGTSDALTEAWAMFTNFFKDIGDQLGNVFFKFWIGIMEAVNNVLGAIDKALNFVGLLSDNEVAANKEGRDNMQNHRVKVADVSNYDAPQTGSLLDKVKDIFAKNQFAPSENLSKQIDEFGTVIGETLAKYQSEEKGAPTKTFENNNRRVTSGIDSMAAIGAGGNVYLGLSMLDISKSQLRQLEQINQKLDRSQPIQTNNFTSDMSAPSTVSRAQTGNVLTPSR